MATLRAPILRRIQDMNLALLAVIAVFLLYMLTGYRRGLVKSVLGTAGIMLAMLLTNLLSPYVCDFLCTHTQLDDNIQSSIEASLVSVEEALMPDDAEDSATIYRQEDFLEKLEIPEMIKNYIRSSITDISTAVTDEVAGYVRYTASYLTDMAMKGISGALTFVLLAVLWRVLMAFTHILHDLPVVGGIDRAGGLLFGAAQALLVVWCLMMAVTFLSAFTWASDIMKMIEDSTVLKSLYDANIFLDMLNGILAGI